LVAENEALNEKVQQLTKDAHELKSESLAKELKQQSTVAELEIRMSQASAAELTAKHELWVARERITVVEEELRQLSATNARLAERCNSAQAEASQAAQKLHINKQELCCQVRLLEDRMDRLHQGLSVSLEERAMEVHDMRTGFAATLQSLQDKASDLEVWSFQGQWTS
jgi:chromosome segregation ATPase